MIQMNRKKNHSTDQKISMNETAATIKASSSALCSVTGGTDSTTGRQRGHHHLPVIHSSHLVANCVRDPHPNG
jgi:hypothetical protein